ncbi:MAG: hypothetical protein AAF548_00575 [Actinomycetota bacterium]
MRRFLAALVLTVVLLFAPSPAGAQTDPADPIEPVESATCEVCGPIAIGATSAVVLALVAWRINRPDPEPADR